VSRGGHYRQHFDLVGAQRVLKAQISKKLVCVPVSGKKIEGATGTDQLLRRELESPSQRNDESGEGWAAKATCAPGT